MAISIQGITKSFGATQVLRGINLEVADGELIVDTIRLRVRRV